MKTLVEFENEEQAKQLASKEILLILSDKSYLNPDKFDKLHLQYKKKIESLEAQLSVAIKTQIDSINNTRNFMDECFQGIENSEQEVELLNQEYVKDQKFHLECQYLEQLSIYRKNVGTMLDQLKYFFNVKAQIQKIEELFQKGPDNYEHINFKLLALTDIRDNVVENLKNDYKTSSKEMQIIISEFQCLSEFEEKFYKTIFSQFEMTLLLSLKNPQLLITLLHIVEAGDKLLMSKGKQPTFKKRALESICQGIDKKFEDRLKDQKEAILVLENSKFTANDLILVLDTTVRCFPKHYDIFNVFEQHYKKNIESRIMPFLDDEEQVTKSYGTLISLLNWVDSYEGLLSRVGLNDDSYVILRSKVKFYMPFFLEHIQTLIHEYSEKAIIKDKEEQQTMKNIEKLIKAKQELITFFPEDLFHFINQQIDILGPKLKGELFIEFIRSICQSLSEIQAKEAKNLISNVPLTEEAGSGLSPVFLVTLYVNNFYKCMSYANETKQYCARFCEEGQQERLDHIFSQDLSKSFNESISMFLEHMLKMVFYEVNQQLVPQLFLPKWVNEDVMTPIINTIKDYLGDIQLLMVNQIYFNKLTKLAYTNLVNIYVEQLIVTVHYVQPTIAKGKLHQCLCSQAFFPKCLTDLSLLMGEDKKKKDKEKKAGIMNILQNKELIVPQINHDCEALMKSMEEEHAQALGKPTCDALLKRFNILVALLTRSKMEIEGLFTQLIQQFDQNSVYILEIGLWIREDCDAAFKQQRTDQFLSIVNKQQAQQQQNKFHQQA